jgi:hypothetical protein
LFSVHQAALTRSIFPRAMTWRRKQQRCGRTGGWRRKSGRGERAACRWGRGHACSVVDCSYDSSVLMNVKSRMQSVTVLCNTVLSTLNAERHMSRQYHANITPISRQYHANVTPMSRHANVTSRRTRRKHSNTLEAWRCCCCGGRLNLLAPLA